MRYSIPLAILTCFFVAGAALAAPPPVGPLAVPAAPPPAPPALPSAPPPALQNSAPLTLPPSQFDLSLSEAFERADRFNPQLVVSRRNLNLAQADITIAGAVPNLQIAAQYGFGSVYTDQANPQQVGVSQTVELGGKRSARLAVADANYRLSQLQLDAQRWQIRSQVRKAYAELAAAAANAASVEAQTALVQRLVDIAAKRFEAGAAPEAELLQAQLSRSQIDTQRTLAEGRLRQARIALASLLGEADPKQDVSISDTGLFKLSVQRSELAPVPNSELPQVETLLGRAYTQRLDLLAVQQQSQVARSQLGLAQSQRVPDLQLSAGYLFTSLANGQPQANGVFLGAGVTVPIFYNQQGEVARAQVTIEQSGLQQAALRAQIAAEVRSAYQALSISRENIRKYQEQLLPASQNVLQLAQESYQVGKTGLTSAIFAQQANQQIRSGYLDAVVAYQSAWADLETAVGSPLSL